MDLKKCTECGRSFGSKHGETLCTRCSDKKVDDDFKKVREYLYAHPGADIKEVAEETGVEEKVIFKLLRDERLEVVEEENSLLKCKECGAPIRTGKLCDTCKKVNMLKGVSEDLKREIENKPNVGYFSRN